MAKTIPARAGHQLLAGKRVKDIFTFLMEFLYPFSNIARFIAPLPLKRKAYTLFKMLIIFISFSPLRFSLTKKLATTSGIARIASLGGGQKGCGQGKEGTKKCGQDKGKQNGCGAWRVTMELIRGRVLHPSVMASVEAPYSMKKIE